MTLVTACAEFFGARTMEEKKALLGEVRSLSANDRQWFANELTKQLGKNVEA